MASTNSDLFNLLPPHLLIVIISLLPFKDAVRTSVLSKKWSNLYKFTTNIEFNELFFVKHGQSEEAKEASKKAFFNFIKSYIESYKGNIVKKFSLRLSFFENIGDIIDQCVAFAIQRGVKELTLDFAIANRNENIVYFDDYEARLNLPALVYQHHSLESLKLYSCSFVESEVFNFHSLKEVFLGWMEVSISSIMALLLNCNLLEILSLKKCWNSEKFDLGAEKHMRLSKLVLDKCRFDFDFFRINAPNLENFQYYGLMNFLVTEIHSLVIEEVVLDFSLEYGFEGLSSPLCNLMANFSTARVLTICTFVLQVIPNGVDHLLVNLNVQHLIMKTALHENEFIGISFFLNICPMLECLTMEICEEKDLFDYEPPFYFSRSRFWIDDVGVYQSLRSTLKEVKINGFRGTTNEHLVLKYLIINGLVLNKISINMLKDDFGRVEPHCCNMAETLLTIPRASRNLEIIIS